MLAITFGDRIAIHWARPGACAQLEINQPVI
jgi:hypothetical protein